MPREYDKYKEGDIHWQWYSNTPGYFDLVNASIAPFEEVTPGTILDVGCGDGLALAKFNELGFKCHGVDPSQEGVELAMKHGVRAEIFIQKAENFAERGLVFDYLYSMNTIEHMDNPGAMVQLMRNTRKFGIVITDFPSKGKMSEYHVKEFSVDEFVRLFSEFNLQQIDVKNPNYFGFKIWNK